MKTCTFPGCDRPYYCKGLCQGHYDQARKGRRPGLIMNKQRTMHGVPIWGCVSKEVYAKYVAAAGKRHMSLSGLISSVITLHAERAEVFANDTVVAPRDPQEGAFMLAPEEDEA